jgi:hypothetical protein
MPIILLGHTLQSTCEYYYNRTVKIELFSLAQLYSKKRC